MIYIYLLLFIILFTVFFKKTENFYPDSFAYPYYNKPDYSNYKNHKLYTRNYFHQKFYPKNFSPVFIT